MVFKITVLGDGGVGKTALTVQVSFDLLRTFGNAMEDADSSSQCHPLSRHMTLRLKTVIGNNGWWMTSHVC